MSPSYLWEKEVLKELNEFLEDSKTCKSCDLKLGLLTSFHSVLCYSHNPRRVVNQNNVN